jgi:hypothetical protein
MLRYNSTSGAIEVYNGTSWGAINKFSATGGTETTVGGYKIHTFTSPGTFSATGSGVGELLLIAGGGSGGSGTRPAAGRRYSL